jgi:hypothetical protein
MTLAVENRVPEPSAWAELERVAVNAHPFAEALGEPEQVPVVTAPAHLTAAAEELQQQAGLRRLGYRTGLPSRVLGDRKDSRISISVKAKEVCEAWTS